MNYTLSQIEEFLVGRDVLALDFYVENIDLMDTIF